MNTWFQISMNRSSSTAGPPSGPWAGPRSTKISEHGPAGPAAWVHQKLSALPRRTMRSDGQAEVLPDPDRLVVRLVDGDPEPVALDPEPLGHELEAPGAGLRLEVVAEGEVAQHLEQREVTVGVTDVLDVVGAEALLDAGGAPERRLGLPQEVRDELVHAGVGEQEAGFGRRDQRRARDARVPALFEERKEPLADLGTVHGARVYRCGRGRITPPGVDAVVATKLLVAVLHRALALRDGLAHQLRQVHDAALGLARDGLRRHAPAPASWSSGRRGWRRWPPLPGRARPRTRASPLTAALRRLCPRPCGGRRRR